MANGAGMVNPFAGGAFTGAGGPGGTSGGKQPTWEEFYRRQGVIDPAKQPLYTGPTSQSILEAGGTTTSSLGRPDLGVAPSGSYQLPLGAGPGGEGALAGLRTSRPGGEAGLVGGQPPSFDELQRAQREAEARLAGTNLTSQAAEFAGRGKLQAQGAQEATTARTQEEQLAEAKMKFGAGLEAEAEKRRIAALPGILGSVTGSVGGPITYGGASGANLDAAQAAVFARAKDQAGLIGRSALTGLRESLAERGVGGGGLEATETARQVLAPAANQLGEVNREELIQRLAAAQHAADMGFTGGITQRGQNLGLAQALAGLTLGGGRLY